MDMLLGILIILALFALRFGVPMLVVSLIKFLQPALPGEGTVQA